MSGIKKGGRESERVSGRLRYKRDMDDEEKESEEERRGMREREEGQSERWRVCVSVCKWREITRNLARGFMR